MPTEIKVWSLLLIVGITHAGNISMSYELSNGSPDFYLDQNLTITCNTSDYTNLQGLSVFFYNMNAVVSRKGCREVNIGHRLRPVVKWIAFSNTPNCTAIANPQGFILEVVHKITERTVGQFLCSALYYNERRQVDRTRRVDVAQVKVAPKNLTITVGTAIEGEILQFRCDSQSNSSSVYQYYIMMGLLVIETQPNVDYNVDERYRDGFSVKCIDIAHMHWTGGNTEAESAMKFSFFFNGSEGELREEFLNSLNMHTLLCDIIGNPSPNFTWTINGFVLNETGNALGIGQGHNVNGDKESIICTGNVNGIALPISITWQITWTDRTTVTWALSTQQTEAPSDPVPLKKNEAASIGLGIGCLAIAAVVSLFIAWKFRQNRRAVVRESTPVVTGSEEVSDAQKTEDMVTLGLNTTEPTNAIPMLQAASDHQHTKESVKSVSVPSAGSVSQSKPESTKSAQILAPYSVNQLASEYGNITKVTLNEDGKRASLKPTSRRSASRVKQRSLSQ